MPAQHDLPATPGNMVWGYLAADEASWRLVTNALSACFGGMRSRLVRHDRAPTARRVPAQLIQLPPSTL